VRFSIRAEKETGVQYFGDGLLVNTVAEGTGDVSKCIFERTAKTSTWRTELGNKLILRNDQQPQPDGPATTPAKPFGSGLPGADVRQQGNNWRYADMDLPSFGLAGQTLPGGKDSTYRFKISNTVGQVFIDRSWSLKIDIDAAGNVTMMPNAGGKVPTARPTIIPTG
jgi:hypothetical protein